MDSGTARVDSQGQPMPVCDGCSQYEEQTTREAAPILTMLDPDPGCAPWETEYLAGAIGGCLNRGVRLGSVLCNLSCPAMQSQPVSVFQCSKHGSITLGKRRTDLHHCVECPDFAEPGESLVSHVVRSIQQADRLQSPLDRRTLAVQGMTSERVRHLLANLCAPAHTRYLEIGCWLGATYLAAQGARLNRRQPAAPFQAVDNFSEFNQYGTAMESFLKNCQTFGATTNLVVSSLGELDPEKLLPNVNVYLYDGDHSPASQRLAITRVWPVLADQFVLVVDDTNMPGVIDATRRAIDEMGGSLDSEWLLPARRNGDTDLWWNGVFVAVVSKHTPLSLHELKENA